MRFCWADKLALVIFALVMLGIVLITARPDAVYVSALPQLTGLVFLWIFVPAWIVLRLVDWAIAGPARRRGATFAGRFR